MKHWLFLGLGLLAGTACGGASTQSSDRNGNGTDSNTHWLSRCTEDADCDDGLSCLCGACTSACVSEVGCAELDGAGICVAAQCDATDDEATLLCSLACERNADCPGEARCDDGVCLPREAQSGEVHSYDPCAGKACGDSCERCAPDDPDCAETEEPKACGPDGTCGEPYHADECEAEPSPIPEGCEFLSWTDEGFCGDWPERCAQMRLDGSTRTLDCHVPSSFYDADGQYVSVTGTAQEQRVECVVAWLEALGASGVAADGDRVSARGTWDEIGPLAESSTLMCHPVCNEQDCDYCYDLDEGSCADDAFCETGTGRRVNLEASCLEPSEFATCRPGDQGCDDALTTAEDESGECWYFGSICYDAGFDYSPSNPLCVYDEYPECSSEPAPDPVAGCEALDVQTSNDCDISPSYAWDGDSCEEASCDCEGADCDRRQESRAACETVWAGCLPLDECTFDAVPDVGTTATFTHGLDPDGDGVNDPDFSYWTLATWPEPVAHPITIDCLAGYEAYCGELRTLVLVSEGQELPPIDVWLPSDLWLELDLEAGEGVEFRMDDTEFAVRDAGTDELLLFVARGGRLTTAETLRAPSQISFTSDAASCKRPADADCDSVDVLQSLRVDAPAAGEDPWQSVVLEPFSTEDIAVPVAAGEAIYRVVHGLSIYRAHNPLDVPSLCEVVPFRRDEFAMARLRP